jgi:H+/Cl- antiporter ClcA
VAATSGFRGGRIFPTLFIGVTLGFAVHQAWPDVVSLPLAVGCSCVGILVAATRSGWLSIFMAVAVVPQMVLLPAFILATLAAYLLVTNRPQLIVPTPPPEAVAAPT